VAKDRVIGKTPGGNIKKSELLRGAMVRPAHYFPSRRAVIWIRMRAFKVCHVFTVMDTRQSQVCISDDTHVGFYSALRAKASRYLSGMVTARRSYRFIATCTYVARAHSFKSLARRTLYSKTAELMPTLET